MYDNDTNDVSELAKKMADRIGHGMSEKCMVHADVALTESKKFKEAIKISMRLAAKMLRDRHGECPSSSVDENFEHVGSGGCEANCECELSNSEQTMECWYYYLLEQGLDKALEKQT